MTVIVAPARSYTHVENANTLSHLLPILFSDVVECPTSSLNWSILLQPCDLDLMPSHRQSGVWVFFFYL